MNATHRHAARRRPLARLGESVAARPWIAIAAWGAVLVTIVGIALFGVGGQTLFDRLSTDAFEVDSESADGQAVLASDTDTAPVTLLVHGADLDDPALRDGIDDARSRLADVDWDGELTVVDPVTLVWTQVEAANAQLPPGAPPVGFDDVLEQIDDPGLQSLIADDGRGALLVATLEDPDEVPEEAVHEVIDALSAAAASLRTALPGATVEVGSATQLIDAVFEQSEIDLRRGETVALPIALVIMLVVFGGFIAAGLPLVGAGSAIAGGFGLLYAMTYVMDVNTTVLNVVTAVGLGLSIDYGLLMVSRFREEFRALGPEPADRRLLRGQVVKAVGRTVDTAGRTALFSGTVFAIASAGLLLFEPTTIKALGVGALLVAAVGVCSAATLMPALLAIAGPRLIRPGLLTRIPGVGRLLLRFGDVAPEEGVFSRLTRWVQRFPALVTLVCIAALLLLGSPIATLRIANSAVDVVPESSSQYGFVTTIREEFPAAASPRVALVARSEADLDAWRDAIEDASIAEIRSIGAAQERGEGWIANVRVDPRDGVVVVPRLRDIRPDGLEGWVVGQDAATYDLGLSLARDAPWAMLLIGLVTLLFLFMATGSFIVPIKALLMSALSLSAAVGVLVWGFEQGNLAGIMHFDASQVHGVDIIVLLLALVFGFGLAMDYEMFILSRIIDLLHSGVPPREAIARGLQRSGRIITSAALIIVIVFGGFATGDLPLIKALGVALAAAVLLDATIVRMLLVPAIMTWGVRVMFWAPRWAKRLHARIGLSE
ncbi:MAG: MMPL family transporter [Microbacteriaceae bacterium]|nr:MMPL family transporter [Microbacteriaceae bacterium]